jgi:uncharacterized repeat protein (TIGR01451 family)
MSLASMAHAARVAKATSSDLVRPAFEKREGAGFGRFFATLTLLALTAVVATAQMMTAPGKLDVSSSGAATYTIPIAVPPGTAGVKPALTLEYSSQNSSGIIGIGWALGGLPAITRCPQTMIQNGVVGAINFDANDRFCLEGQQLVAISGTYGADGTEYRTEIESYSRVISHGNAVAGPAWFEVRTKSGQIMEFGNTSDSRPLTPAGTARSWLINKLSDTKGNYLTATYNNDATNGQIYPTRIDYTGNAAASVAPYNSVQFEYATRPDIVPLYHAGVMTKTTVRLTNVKTYTGTTLVSDYRLAYDQGPGSPRSRVTSITPCAGEGSCLPATTFAWTNGSAGFSQVNQTVNRDLSGGGGFIPVAGSADFLPADFSADGKHDFTFVSGNILSSFASNGDGTFTNVTQSLSVNYGTPPSSSWSAISGDFNGDGKTDFAFLKNTSLHVYLSQDDGTFAFSTSTLPTDFGSPPGTSWTTFGGDFNGDGRADFLVVNHDTVSTFLSNGDGSFANVVQTFTCTGGSGGGCFIFGIPRSRTPISGDFNGDSKSDFGFVQNNVLQSLLSQGDGTFALTTLTLPTDFGSPPTNSWTPLIGDFNGDGKTEFMFVGGNTISTFLSNGDGTFGNVVQTVGCGGGGCSTFGNPPTASRTPISGDFNGDGKSDFGFVQNNSLQVYVSNGDGTFAQQDTQALGTNFGSPPHATWTPLGGDFNGDGKSDFAFAGNGTIASFLGAGAVPDLLVSVTSGLGITTTITYAPLTQNSVYTKDTNGTYPTVDMIGSFQAVSRVDTANGIGGTYSTTYTYAGAKSDVRGRFLGFRQMTAQDLQTNVVQTSNFRQDFPFIGMVDNSVGKLGTQTLKQSTNSYQFSNASGVATVSTPSVNSAPYRAMLTQNVTSSADLDGSALPTVTTTNQFDAFGNATQVVVSTPDGFSKTTTNTYINDVTNWYLGRLTSASVTSQAPAPPPPPPPLIPDLTISKTHFGNFVQRQTGAYSIVVTNAGAASTAGMVTVSDTLPSGLAATSISGTGWTCTVATTSCTRSDALAGGASYPAITLSVNVAADTPASVTNVASVFGGGDTHTNNNSASDPTTITPEPTPPDLRISKAHSGSFVQGQTGATYSIAVSNIGTGPTFAAVSVTDTLPPGLAATAISGAGWSCTLATASCTRSDALAVGASYPAITLTVNVAPNAPASVTNVASVSGGGDTNMSNNTASDPTTIVSNVVIQSNTSNLNLWNYLVAQGAATPGMPGSWIVTIAGGVVIGSSSTSVPAFDTGAFPSGSTVQIVNNGTIVGAGGSGGNGGGNPEAATAGASGGLALLSQVSVTIANNGSIWGGGGGGGGGGANRSLPSGGPAGGGGGGGAGSNAGAGGAGGTGLVGSASFGSPGSAGTLSGGGGGGAGGVIRAVVGGTGGNGGGPGQAGASGGQSTPAGATPGGGGAAGAAVNGNSFITWTNVGDRRGAVN